MRKLLPRSSILLIVVLMLLCCLSRVESPGVTSGEYLGDHPELILTRAALSTGGRAKSKFLSVGRVTGHSPDTGDNFDTPRSASNPRRASEFSCRHRVPQSHRR